MMDVIRQKEGYQVRHFNNGVLQASLRALINNPIHSDIRFVVKGRENNPIHAHKLILSLRFGFYIWPDLTLITFPNQVLVIRYIAFVALNFPSVLPIFITSGDSCVLTETVGD